MFQEYLPQLCTCRLFQEITPRDLLAMLECLQPQIMGCYKQELIAVAGERYGGLGVVLTGTVLVTKENAAGDRVILAVLKPGAVFGEMVAFAKRKVWPATLVAQTDCRVMLLAPEKIVTGCANCCHSHRQLTVNVLGIISEKALELHRKVEYLALGSLREKIGRYLLEQYHATGRATFILPLNRDELADFLHTTRPSLSRELGRMRDEGLLEFHRASVRIINLDALKAGLSALEDG